MFSEWIGRPGFFYTESRASAMVFVAQGQRKGCGLTNPCPSGLNDKFVYDVFRAPAGKGYTLKSEHGTP